MKTITIKVNELVSCNKGVTPDEGKVIYDMLIEAFNEGKQVILNFSGVEMMTTAFLNVAIGNLYKTYTSEQLKEMLKFEKVSEMTAFRIKKVTDNAKEFYKNQEEFSQTVKEVLDENN
jgi:hypothetical protein